MPRFPAKILAENASELQNTGKFITKVANSFNVVQSIGNDILYDSIGITDLSRKQLNSKVETLKVEREILRTAQESAKTELKNTNTPILTDKMRKYLMISSIMHQVYSGNTKISFLRVITIEICITHIIYTTPIT